MNKLIIYGAMLILIITGVMLFRSNIDDTHKFIFAAIMFGIIAILSQVDQLTSK